METIQRARVYFLDYLQRCKSYAITAKVPVVSVTGSTELQYKVHMYVAQGENSIHVLPLIFVNNLSVC